MAETVTEFLTEIREQMCDNYCIYRRMADNAGEVAPDEAQEYLQAICDKCPMNFI